VALDWPRPQNETICLPQGRYALNSTWEKLLTECRRKDAGEQNQLIRAEEESKRQATVPGSSHGLKFPMAQRGLNE